MGKEAAAFGPCPFQAAALSSFCCCNPLKKSAARCAWAAALGVFVSREKDSYPHGPRPAFQRLGELLLRVEPGPRISAGSPYGAFRNWSINDAQGDESSVGDSPGLTDRRFDSVRPCLTPWHRFLRDNIPTLHTFVCPALLLPSKLYYPRAITVLLHVDLAT